VDQNGNVLAYKGSSIQVPKLAQKSTNDVYVFENPLAHPGNPHNRDILKKAGFTLVNSMAGGMNAWKAAGYPTVSGQ
jgi:hypothetical protein